MWGQREKAGKPAEYKCEASENEMGVRAQCEFLD